MTTIDSVLRRSLEGRGGDLVLTLPPAFQGLPETAHGGAVLAAFDALAGLTAPRDVAGTYKKRVPLATPLALAVAHNGDARTFTLRDADGTLLVDGRVAPAADVVGAGRVPSSTTLATEPEVAASQASRPAAPRSNGSPKRTAPAPTHPLPISRTCFACGTDNPLGLRVRLEFDDAEVRGTWRPRECFRDADGALATAALTTLLDEAAFWLGALATGESGMTTELRVTLLGPVPFGAPLTVSGARAGVRPRPDDGRYWDTAVVARAEDGRPVAAARITFVAVRGAARRLVGGLLALNDPALLRRVFPAYARA